MHGINHKEPTAESRCQLRARCKEKVEYPVETDYMEANKPSVEVNPTLAGVHLPPRKLIEASMEVAERSPWKFLSKSINFHGRKWIYCNGSKFTFLEVNLLPWK